MPPLEELTAALLAYRDDEVFQAELAGELQHYSGRPTPAVPRRTATASTWASTVLLKREDLNHLGAHKLNNCLGQALLAKRMGKKKIIAETGAGQHGVATAAVAARLGLACDIYMGEEDMRRQKPERDPHPADGRPRGAGHQRRQDPDRGGGRGHRRLGGRGRHGLLPAGFGRWARIPIR